MQYRVKIKGLINNRKVKKRESCKKKVKTVVTSGLIYG